jgi:hypothetical protein
LEKKLNLAKEMNASTRESEVESGARKILRLAELEATIGFLGSAHPFRRLKKTSKLAHYNQFFKDLPLWY